MGPHTVRCGAWCCLRNHNAGIVASAQKKLIISSLSAGADQTLAPISLACAAIAIAPRRPRKLTTTVGTSTGSAAVPGKRDFFTGSTRIISDPRPSGLDLRVYACVSMHDGMSLKKGTGRGCYATFARLTAEIGCDASNLSKSLKRLVDWAYLLEERQEDRRRKTYRVIFDGGESWRNNHQPFVGETANSLSGIVGQDECRNAGNPPQIEAHYSSLKGLDPSEEEKLDSPKGAHLTARRARRKVKLDDNVGAQLAIL